MDSKLFPSMNCMEWVSDLAVMLFLTAISKGQQNPTYFLSFMGTMLNSPFASVSIVILLSAASYTT